MAAPARPVGVALFIPSKVGDAPGLSKAEVPFEATLADLKDLPT
jgi:hypothetical protein